MRLSSAILIKLSSFQMFSFRVDFATYSKVRNKRGGVGGSNKHGVGNLC